MSRKKRSFTLIELVITIGVAALIMAAVGGFIVKSIEIWAYYRDENAAHLRIRTSVDRIIQSIRKMNTAGQLSVAGIQEVRFGVIEEGVANEIGIVLIPPRLLFYDQNALNSTSYSDSYKSQNTYLGNYLTFEIAPDVTNLEIKYYKIDSNGNYTEALDLADFQSNGGRLIKIILTVQEGRKTFTVGSLVGLRSNLP